MKRSVSRWIPAFLAPVLVAATAIGASMTAGADVSLPAKTASEVLQFINTNPDVAFSGEVTKTASLGLPPVNLLPNISQAAVDQMKKTLPKAMSDFIPKASVSGNLATILGLLSGTQQANVYYNGPSQARVQILDQMSERDFVVNGPDAWFYDATQQTVTHFKMTNAEKTQADNGLLTLFTQNASKLPFDVLSPSSIANYFLSQITPSTNVSVGTNALVAGRGVYQLTLTPKTSGTLISSVVISVDGSTGVPLAVTVNAVGQSAPAFSVAFNSINFAPSASSIFAFGPPVGATVQEIKAPSAPANDAGGNYVPTSADKAAAEAQIAKLKAEGWSAVVEIPQSQISAQSLASIESNPYFTNLTKAVSGGRVFTTSLFSILFTNDGRVFAGAVTTQKLLEAAVA